MSDALGDDRMNQEVGPYRIEVIEPLQKLRLICDGDEHGVGFDLTWEGSFPVVDEARHTWRRNGRINLDAQRFAQVGTWEGVLAGRRRGAGGHARHAGSGPATGRGASGGVGEAEPPGRGGDEPIEGFWWTYIPMRFDDFAVIVILQEEPDGTRVMNDVVARLAGVERVAGPSSWAGPRSRSATRRARGSRPARRCTSSTPGRKELTARGRVARVRRAERRRGLRRRSRLGPRPVARAASWVEGAVYDLTDPMVPGAAAFSVIDHVGRATLDGEEGWGLFEHGCFGRHDPSGFADYRASPPNPTRSTLT